MLQTMESNGNGHSLVTEIPPQKARPRTLYAIGTDTLALHALLDELEGDLTDEQVSQAVAEWWSEIETDRDTKLQNYARLIREFAATAVARRTEARYLAARAQVAENAVGALKRGLREFMDATGESKLKAGAFNISIKGNGGLAPLKVLVEAEDLPPEYQITTADNDAIRAAIAEQRPGIEKIAELLPRGDHVEVR